MTGRLVTLADEFANLLLDSCREGSHAWCVAHRVSDQNQELARLADSVQHCVRNCVVNDRFDASGRTSRLNAAGYHRGLLIERVISPRTVAAYPLARLTSMYARSLVIAPVRSTMILQDRSILTFAGPIGQDETITMWRSRAPNILQAAIELTDRQLAEGERVELLPVTDVNERRLHVLIKVLQGLTDTAIAHSLGMALRTVERDVSALRDLAGVVSRVELMAAAAGYDLS